MAEFDVKTGHDTYVNELSTAQNNATARYPRLRSGDEFRTLLFMPLAPARISNKTILSATLSIPVQSNWVDQTVTVQALSASWNVDTVTWANQPGVTGSTASSSATGALSAGDRFEINVTTLVQAIANGQANYGWRLTTSQTTSASTVRGFDSGEESWKLTVSVSDLPLQPSQLSPAGVISVNKWVAAVDEVDDIASMQVQIDAAADSVSPDFDSGWRTVTRPKLDLSAAMGRSVSVTTTNGSATFLYASGAIEAADVGATISGTGIPGGATILTAGATSGTISANATASGTITATVTRTYAGLADGATTYWRARTNITDGSASAWSDWVSVTRAVKPSIVMDAPTGTTLYDPTPTIAAHLNPVGTADTRWQVIVHAAGDATDIRYNSGDALSGASLSHEVPLWWKGRKVFPTDGNYGLIVRAWDRADRVPSEGDPPFAKTTVTVTLSTQAAITAPTAVTATQADDSGKVTVGWQSGVAATKFVALDDGEIAFVVDAADALVSPGVYSWSDLVAKPDTAHTYTMRAVADNAGVSSQSPDSTSAALTTTVSGVWLRSGSNSVRLVARSGMVAKQVDKRQTYELPYRAESVDIVTAIGGIEGTCKAQLVAPTVAKLALLERWRQSGERLRLVWGTHNILADIKGLSVTFSPESASTKIYDVEFGFAQVDEPGT